MQRVVKGLLPVLGNDSGHSTGGELHQVQHGLQRSRAENFLKGSEVGKRQREGVQDNSRALGCGCGIQMGMQGRRRSGLGGIKMESSVLEKARMKSFDPTSKWSQVQASDFRAEVGRAEVGSGQI